MNLNFANCQIIAQKIVTTVFKLGDDIIDKDSAEQEVYKNILALCDEAKIYPE